MGHTEKKKKKKKKKALKWVCKIAMQERSSCCTLLKVVFLSCFYKWHLSFRHLDNEWGSLYIHFALWICGLSK
jgi:hypothetical protein